MNEELIAMNEELVSTLDRLKQTQQQLLQSEKLAALGGLVSGIAHEISTPLGISVTSVSYVQRELHQMSRNFREGTLTRSDFDEFLTSATPVIDTAETNLERAALLLGSFKQLSADQTHDTLRRFNAKDYLEELLLSLQGLLKTRDCSMTLDCPDDLEIVGSPGLLSQVVTNLVSNAVKHGFDPHVPGSIRMELKKEGVVTTLIFSDDGKGMSEAVQEHIFEPFFSTRQGIHSELGLGLHMVHTIVTQRFGGEIRCITSPGQGTRFILTIPDSI